MNNSEFKKGQEVWVKLKVKNPEIDRDGEIQTVNEAGWEIWVKPEEIMVEIPEKPVIPQFVAEWIRYCKSNKLTLLGAFDPVSENGIGFAETFTGEVWEAVDWAKRNQDIFACAWLFGYEIEKEKLYTVEIPNPNTDAVTCLARNEETGKIVIDCLWEMDEVKNGWKLDNDCQLAESEIRKDFEWAWKWAEPAED